MTPFRKQIIAGVAGYLAIFLTQVVGYMQGLIQAGQSWSDAEPLQLIQYGLTAFAGALAGLQALLTDNATPTPPTDAPRLDPPDVNL